MNTLALALLLMVGYPNFSVSEQYNRDEYNCVLCMSTVDRMLQESLPYDSACSRFNWCDAEKARNVVTEISRENAPKDYSVMPDSRKVCENINMCVSQDGEMWLKSLKASNGLDIRVSKAHASRGYNKVRLSVISNQTLTSTGVFTYNEQFKYRWTSNVLNTGLVDVIPGEKNSFVVDGKTIEITIPKDNEGVRGIIIADPCFQTSWVSCAYKDKFKTFERMTETLNTIHSHDDTSYWMILGDNFYDQSGEPTKSWFGALSDASKARAMASYPGNHDFWVAGTPESWTKKDQQANGFMQWYGQDVAASVSSSSSSPYDFTVDPDANPSADSIPPLSNFFSYYKLGNTAFIGFSGAHSYESTLPYFEEACKWAETENPAVILLLGHWNGDGMGCDSDMTVPSVYKELSSNAACSKVAHKFKYVMGHTHSNVVTEKDVGLMVAGQGMSGSGDFGFPVFDTTVTGRFKVYYFSYAKAGVFDEAAYSSIIDCVSSNGVSGCYGLATQWVDTAL